MLDRPVPCFFEGDLLRKRVERILSEADLAVWVPGSVAELAGHPDEIGVSREYLSRAAGAEGIRLVAYLDACNALNALAEVEIEERSWSEVAVRMGYPWQSGLTELLKRGLGATPTSARSRSLKE